MDVSGLAVNISNWRVGTKKKSRFLVPLVAQKKLWPHQAHFSTGDECGGGTAVPAWVARGPAVPLQASAVL